MLMTLYPNGELRARIPCAPLKRRAGDSLFKDSKIPESLTLSIVENLRSDFADAPFKPVKEVGRPGYGDIPTLREFSVYARRAIARVGGVISELGGRESVLFLTGTIPGGTKQALEAVSTWSAWICHELVTHLPRLAGLKPSECRYLWVWEWQKRGALHWHCVIETPSRELSKKIFDGFKGLWVRVIESVGKREGCDMAERAEGGTHAGDYGTWRTRAEWARKNPARYLAKYMAKVKTGCVESEDFFPPSRWYSISRSLLETMRDRTITGSTHINSKIPDRIVDPELDLGTIEKLVGISSCTRSFGDKVRDGFTFVFYIKEEEMNAARSMFEDWTKTQNTEMKRRPASPQRKRFPNLIRIGKHRRPFERFLADIGPRDAKLYVDWIRGLYIPQDDLEFLDGYAERVLIWEGYDSGVKPDFPKGGLTGQGEGTLEIEGGSVMDNEQPSLFP